MGDTLSVDKISVSVKNKISGYTSGINCIKGSGEMISGKVSINALNSKGCTTDQQIWNAIDEMLRAQINLSSAKEKAQDGTPADTNTVK
jgi:hypothetical protein